MQTSDTVRGSLAWITSARVKIGIDVLATQYADAFTDDILSHGMFYVTSTEHVIPLPAESVDIMFTLNAIDHVENFDVMCDEIIRVLKPGGEFIGSFNMGEPVTPFEPQHLTEDFVKESLLNKLEVKTYRITNKAPEPDAYAAFFDGSELRYDPAEEGFLWVRAEKPEI